MINLSLMCAEFPPQIWNLSGTHLSLYIAHLTATLLQNMSSRPNRSLLKKVPYHAAYFIFQTLEGKAMHQI